MTQSNATPDPKTPHGKVTKHKETSHTIEPRGQLFPSKWSQGKTVSERQTWNINNQRDPQKYLIQVDMQNIYTSNNNL